MVFDDMKLDVNMTGKEYVDYLKYRDTKRFKMPKMSHDKMLGYFIIIASCLSLAFIPAIIDYFNPPEPTHYIRDYGLSYIYNIPIPNFLIWVMVFMVSVSWLFHGVGFTIVRR